MGPLFTKWYHQNGESTKKGRSFHYKTRSPGSVTSMLKNLDLPLLQERRKELRLTFLFKVVEGLVQAIPPDTYLTPATNKRKVRATRFVDFDASNIVHSTNNSKCFAVQHCKTTVWRHSLFTRTIPEWNSLSEQQVTAKTVESFRASFQRD